MKTYLLSLSLLLLSFSGMAQTRELKGIVQSKLDPKIRIIATIFVVGDSKKTVNTDKNGEFTITLPQKELTLRIGAPNYHWQKVTIGALQTNVLIELTPQLGLSILKDEVEEEKTTITKTKATKSGPGKEIVNILSRHQNI